VWWRLLGLGLGLSLVGAIGALVFVRLVALGTDLVWGDDPMSVDLFSGTLIMVVIMTGAGLLVGIIHRLISDAAAGDVFGGLVEGRMDTKPVTGGLLVSLIGGYPKRECPLTHCEYSRRFRRRGYSENVGWRGANSSAS
jgi:hypothetical protein